MDCILVGRTEFFTFANISQRFFCRVIVVDDDVIVHSRKVDWPRNNNIKTEWYSFALSLGIWRLTKRRRLL